jgi:hypothetical protein
LTRHVTSRGRATISAISIEASFFFSTRFFFEGLRTLW